MADASRRAQARLAPDDGRHQLVGVQAALHQRLGLAFAHELDRLRGGRLAVGRVDDRQVREIDTVLLRQRFDACPRPDQDRRDQPSCAASTAPRSELSSQGCATAVGVGGSALQKSSSR